MSYHDALRLLCSAAFGFLAPAPARAQQIPCSSHTLSSPTRVIAGAQLTTHPSRSALELVEQYVPNTFEVVGSALALWARGEAAGGLIVEPLLLVDGTPMTGGIAAVLDGLTAGDLARIAVHKGRSAAWQFRPGGAVAVIEVTTVAGERALAAAARICSPGGFWS